MVLVLIIAAILLLFFREIRSENEFEQHIDQHEKTENAQ